MVLIFLGSTLVSEFLQKFSEFLGFYFYLKQPVKLVLIRSIQIQFKIPSQNPKSLGPSDRKPTVGIGSPEPARVRPRRSARLSSAQRREVEGGADKRDPPVSGRSEAARSDSNASGLGGAASLRDAVALGRKRRDPIQRWASDRTAHNR